jgi:hypothetical protein
MKIYNVYFNNGREYDDEEEIDFLIAAENEEEAEDIAKELCSKSSRFYIENGVEISVTEITKTDNGVEIIIKGGAI